MEEVIMHCGDSAGDNLVQEHSAIELFDSQQIHFENQGIVPLLKLMLKYNMLQESTEMTVAILLSSAPEKVDDTDDDSDSEMRFNFAAPSSRRRSTPTSKSA